jgi:predicted DNA repair protein MutK
MASGLVALLDDVAGIAKMAAASLDDVAGAAGKAGSKAVGVVVDDTAVTPGYAMGFTPDRELPIVWKIALGSLRNKFFFLLPGALLLSAFAPWAVTPILMLGGAYLSFEAAEKILEAIRHEDHADAPAELALGSAELENQKVSGAIRTDLILSAEIVAIALADVANQPLGVQAAALAIVGLAITVGVYGVVGLIVKMDDIGLHMARRQNAMSRRVGAWLVKGMPAVLGSLGVIGTAAMLWVGGGIVVHGLEHYHVPIVPDLVEGLRHAGERIPGVGGIMGWLGFAVGSALVGLALGGALAAVMAVVHRVRGTAH